MVKLRCLIFTLLSLSIFLPSAQAYDPLIDLSFSKNSANSDNTIYQAGDLITVSVDVGEANSRTAIFVGGMPDKYGELSGKWLWSIGLSGSDKKYQASGIIPEGFDHTQVYFWAIARKASNRKLVETPKRGVVVIPAEPDYIVTPSSYQRVGSSPVSHGSPIEHVLNNLCQPGELIMVEPGLHPRFKVDRDCSANDNPCYVVSRHILEQEGNMPTITRHNVGGSPTVRMDRGGCIALGGLYLETSPQSGIEFDMNEPFEQFFMYESVIDGQWNWEMASGYNNTKWGIQGHGTGYSILRKVTIENIKEEHAIYLHGPRDDFIIENSTFKHTGRTALQIASRIGEGLGNENMGNIVVRNSLIEDVSLGDGCSQGGSNLSFNGRGRADKIILVEANTIRAGYNSQLNDQIGCIAGSGALVAHWGDYSGDINNAPIIFKNNLVEYAGSGNRTNINIEATHSFTFENNYIFRGDTSSKETLHIATEPMLNGMNSVSLDSASVVSNEHTLSGSKFRRYRDLVSFVQTSIGQAD